MKGSRESIETRLCAEANFPAACNPTREGFGIEGATFCSVLCRLLCLPSSNMHIYIRLDVGDLDSRALMQLRQS